MKIKNCTLVFLIKKREGRIAEICLAMKKRDFGVGKWNGVGGKVKENEETVEQAVHREVQEEILVEVGELKKVAELHFYFSDKPEWDQIVHTYVCEEWKGDPTETDEMRPQWFAVDEIPYDVMWPEDPYWLPTVLAGGCVRASFTSTSDGTILEQEVVEVEAL